MLQDLTIRDFVSDLSSGSPAPGGGSAAALTGALGSALTAMVACLTQGRKKYAEYEAFAAQVQLRSDTLTAKLLDVMDRDTLAFNAVSAAFALPKDSEEEKLERSQAIQTALKGCTDPPLECMELCDEAIDLCYDFLESGFNLSSASDLGVSFLNLKSAMQSAWLNLLINLSSIRDEAFTEAYRARGKALLARAIPLADEGFERVLSLVEG